MILPITAGALRALHDDACQHPFDPDSALAPLEVLHLLAELAACIEPAFVPAAWLILDDGQPVGLCSATRIPVDGELNIGYGIAPNRQGRGITTRAIGDLVRWCAHDGRLRRLTAETAPDNIASQRVLARNGFVQVGHGIDADAGPVLCWALELP
ncbi:GNAT family N-acetyltransferase [Stenotrophomonas sp. LGBM10]|uniref:GNAT family N-acetyltransferase n=1 Tax=Stenotrophomonas sp. LGBM10 TaxID=3390038 RepID=UPI00398A65BC